MQGNGGAIGCAGFGGDPKSSTASIPWEDMYIFTGFDGYPLVIDGSGGAIPY